MIIREAHPYRDGPDVVEYRHTQGATPICRLAQVDDHWEVVFFRGPKNLGPYNFPSREAAERRLNAYLEAHGDRLVGPLNAWSVSRPLYSETAPLERSGQRSAELLRVAKRHVRRRPW